MGPVEIAIIVLAVLAVVGSLITYIVRKIKGKPTGSCAGCPYVNNCKHGGSCCDGQSVDTSQHADDKNDKTDK